MTIRYLKNRWLENENAHLALNEIFQILKNGGVLKEEHTPFGKMENGYADFRGIDLSSQKIVKLEIEKADLSHSSFYGSWIEKSILKDVFFEKTGFEEISDKGNLFENISFINCKFNKAGLGYDGSQFVNCKFERTGFTGAVFIRSEFQGCVFDCCKLNGVDFNASSFEECSFIGKLDGVWFRGKYPLASNVKEFGEAIKNQMKNVSFEEAILEGVNFSNECDLSNVQIPKTGRYQIFDNWASRLKKLKTKIGGWPMLQRMEAEIFTDSYLVHAKTQDWFLINIEEIEQGFGVDVAQNIITVLNEK